MPNVPDFNTSHVSINQKREWAAGMKGAYFNTSHVSINLLRTCGTSWRVVFQYISCFY